MIEEYNITVRLKGWGDDAKKVKQEKQQEETPIKTIEDDGDNKLGPKTTRTNNHNTDK